MKTAAVSSVLRPLPAVLALAVLALTSGCVALVVGAAVGAGATVAYTRGTLEAWLNGGFDQTLAATNKAVAQLGFAKIGEQTDGVSMTVTVRTTADKKIDIKLSHGGDHLTQVKIRAGLLGDEALSKAVLEKIKAAL